MRALLLLLRTAAAHSSRPLLLPPLLPPTSRQLPLAMILNNSTQQQQQQPNKRVRLLQCPATATAAAAMAGEQPPPALDDDDWQAIQLQLQRYDAQRETVIKRCRDAQKAAKQAIYALHRGDQQRASELLATVEAVAEELGPIVAAEPSLRPGSFANAMEEYAEARVFQAFLETGRVLRAADLAPHGVQTEEYLGGVLDFTGELNRWAVLAATARDAAAVARARDVADALMGQFLQLDLRNGALRKKYDALKYTLKRLETTLYELSLAEATGVLRSGRDAEQEPPPTAGDDGGGGGGGSEPVVA